MWTRLAGLSCTRQLQIALTETWVESDARRLAQKPEAMGTPAQTY